jgi:NitT/TauT family transport system permease protein
MNRAPATVLKGALLPIGLLLAAELALGSKATDLLAPPSAALRALWALALDGSLWRLTAQTLGSTLAGLALGGGAGLLLGGWFGLARRAAQAGGLTVELLRPMPAVALIPLAMLVFGLGWRMEIAVVAFASLWPMLLLTQAAVAQVDPCLIDVGRMLRLTPVARFRKLVLPAALPRLVVALRLALGVALVVAVSVEVVANPQGLGFAMIDAQQSLQPDQMLALLAWTGVLGWGANAVLLGLERWLSPERRGAGGAR